MPPPISIDDYLAKVPEPAHSTLQKLRATILAAAPKGTIETIAYGMPAFSFKKHIAGFAAFKDHCSYFPMSGGVIETLAPDLAKYQLSKGTVQFPLNKTLPATIVRKLIQARLAEIELKKKSATPPTTPPPPSVIAARRAPNTESALNSPIPSPQNPNKGAGHR